MRNAVRRLLAPLYLLAFFGSTADAQILNQSNIEQVCKSPPATHRRTLVYVDISSITKGRTEWGLTLINRLELGVREPLTILAVNPNTFEIGQAFDLCYPTLTKSEIEGARTGRSHWDRLVSSDPEDQQRENLQTFDARLKNALDKVLADAGSKADRERIFWEHSHSTRIGFQNVPASTASLFTPTLSCSTPT